MEQELERAYERLYAAVPAAIAVLGQTIHLDEDYATTGELREAWKAVHSIRSKSPQAGANRIG